MVSYYIDKTHHSQEKKKELYENNLKENKTQWFSKIMKEKTDMYPRLATDLHVATYPDIVSPDFYITHGMAVVGSTSGEAAVLADSHMLGFTMIQSVLIMLWTAPGPDVLSVHQ